MRRIVVCLVLVALALFYGVTMPRAGRAPDGLDAPRPEARLETGAVHATFAEIVVFEVENCAYCPAFRRDVLPAWQMSNEARRLPIRFVDVNDAAVDRLGLDGPVRMVPTVVVLRSNREIGRIDGYMGPQHFFAFVRGVLPSLD